MRVVDSRSRRLEEALVEARRAVAFEPWDCRHHLAVAQALAGLPQWDGGLVHANKAYHGSQAQGSRARDQTSAFT